MSWELLGGPLGRRGALATFSHHLQILPVAFPTQINKENVRVFLPWSISSFSL